MCELKCCDLQSRMPMASSMGRPMTGAVQVRASILISFSSCPIGFLPSTMWRKIMLNNMEIWCMCWTVGVICCDRMEQLGLWLQSEQQATLQPWPEVSLLGRAGGRERVVVVSYTLNRLKYAEIVRDFSAIVILGRAHLSVFSGHLSANSVKKIKLSVNLND